jgi:hypothetical protein
MGLAHMCEPDDLECLVQLILSEGFLVLLLVPHVGEADMLRILRHGFCSKTTSQVQDVS